MSVDPETEALLRRAYDAFNARDIEAAIALMHPEVDWPNPMEATATTPPATCSPTRRSCTSTRSATGS